MPNIQNLRMSACTISFGGVTLGHTNGGIVFHYEPKLNPLTADQYGDTPIDMVLGGETIQVVANLAEPVVDLLAVAIPEGTENSAGSGARLHLGRDGGYGLRLNAKQLVLHPIEKAASDTSEDVVLYLAAVADTVELNYEVDNQRVYKVTFQAFLSETYGNGRRLGHIGSTNIS